MNKQSPSIFQIYNPNNGAVISIRAYAKEALCKWLCDRIQVGLGYGTYNMQCFYSVFKVMPKEYRFRGDILGRVFIVGPGGWDMPDDENPDQKTFDQLGTSNNSVSTETPPENPTSPAGDPSGAKGLKNRSGDLMNGQKTADKQGTDETKDDTSEDDIPPHPSIVDEPDPDPDDQENPPHVEPGSDEYEKEGAEATD